MKKTLRRGALVAAVVFASATVHAQSPVIEEHFNEDGFATEQGYTVGQSPSALESVTFTNTASTPCDPAGDEPAENKLEILGDNTYTVTSKGATYTLVNAGVAPGCEHKGHGNTNVCETTNPDVAHGSTGYVHLSNTASANGRGSLTTPLIWGVTKIKVVISATGGSERNAVLQKSTDGVTFTDIEVLSPNNHPASTCGQYGLEYEVEVNETGAAYYRIATAPRTGTTTYDVVRIHDLIVEGTVPLGVSKSDAAWFEGGLKVTSYSNTLSLTSEKKSGSVEVLNLSGVVVAQKEVHKGGNATFVLPTSGLYIVKFVAEEKAYTKKVAVQ